MPVRNGAPHLRDALESLLRQSAGDFELIVSDNASRDATPDILAEVATRDSRVRLIRRQYPLPAVAHFNSLIHIARGDYFMWAAADDTWDHEFIQRLSHRLNADDASVMAFCALDNVRPEDSAIPVRRILPRPDLDSSDVTERMRAYLLDDEAAGKANLVYSLMRRPALVQVRGMVEWPTSHWGCDMLSVFRLLGLGRVAWEEDTLFRKRLAIHELTTTSNGGPPVPLRLLPSWHGYILGYLRIIASTGALGAAGRRELTLATLGKLARGDQAAMKHLLRRLGLRS
jgi:glycosyltransferase involved in cell wall biosynthesis